MDSSRFSLTAPAKDPVYGLFDDFLACARADKLNLAIGIVPDFDGGNGPFLFQAVQSAFKQVVLNDRPHFGYCPLRGNLALQSHVATLLKLEPENSYASIQSVGGTGALSTLGALYKRMGVSKLFLPKPSWPNHEAIFRNLGFEIESLDWLDPSGGLNEAGLLAAMARDGGRGSSLFLFQLSCHNPTGIDPTHAQWDLFLQMIQKHPSLHLLFDAAYLGFHSKSIEYELYPIQRAQELGLSFSVAFSAAKSLGLYSERVGVAYYIGPRSHLTAVQGHMSSIQRAIYSSPPKFGALIAEKVLDQSGEFFGVWVKEIAELAARLKKIRQELPGQNRLKEGEGLFTIFSSLSVKDIHRLAEQEAIFMTEDGRINIAALANPASRRRFIESLARVLP